MAAWRKAGEEAQYTFTNIQVLAHLPNTPRSQQYLERLRDDPGIKKVMRKYKWTVGVLQEMEPIGNTDMNSKTLGKNWNKGQVIEVRLRTDSYDGWRDYKTVSLFLSILMAQKVNSCQRSVKHYVTNLLTWFIPNTIGNFGI